MMWYIFFWIQEIEKKIKELQAACEEMKKEINNRQLESKTLKEDVENTKRENVLEAKELEKSQDEMEKLKVIKDLIHHGEGNYLGFGVVF